MSVCGGQAVTSADLLMQAHIQNIVHVLNLNRKAQGEQPLDLQLAASGKYPAVASWLDGFSNVTAVQKYQSLFESEYLQSMH